MYFFSLLCAPFQNMANPTALLLSSVMMLRHLDLHDKADRIQNAILTTIAEGKYRTGDLGGSSSTTEFTNAICDHLWTLLQHIQLMFYPGSFLLFHIGNLNSFKLFLEDSQLISGFLIISCSCQIYSHHGEIKSFGL